MGCGWASHKPSLKIKGINLLPTSNFLKFFLRGNSDVQRWRCSKLRSHLIHAIDTGRLDLRLWNQHPSVGNYVGKTSIILSQHGNTSLKQFFENSGLSRNRWFHFADVLGTWEQLQVRWDQYLEATSRQCLSGSKTLGLTRNHKFKDNVYVGIYIYLHVLQSYNIHILYVCEYNNSPTWTKGSKIQDSLCRNLQGVRLAARGKVWVFTTENFKKSGRQGRHIEVCISSGFKSTLHNFLKPILKFQVFLGPVRPSGSRETPKKKPSVHFFGISLRNCIKLTSKLFHMLFQVQGLAE